jgi:hypothetical protein
MIRRLWREKRRENRVPTRYAHSMTPVQGVPYHGPVCDGYQCFGEFFWVSREGIVGDSWATENQGLKAWRRHGLGVRH